MKKFVKKTFALILSIAMVLSVIPVSAQVVSEGANGKTMYLSTDFYSDIKEYTKATSVAKDHFITK